MVEEEALVARHSLWIQFCQLFLLEIQFHVNVHDPELIFRQMQMLASAFCHRYGDNQDPRMKSKGMYFKHEKILVKL